MNKIERLLDMVDSEILMSMVQEVNSWDSSLEHLRYMYMDDLEDYLLEVPAINIINMVYYGDFNPNDDYFAFNAYGNLVSYCDWEISQELEDYKEDIVERFMELYEEGHVDIWDEEVKAILDSEEEEEE